MKPPRPPLIPERFIDAPSQRLYLLSLAFLCQAVKLLDFIGYLASSDDTHGPLKKWLLFDVAFCLALTSLRVPRLTYSRTTLILQIVLLVVFDNLIFGGISLNVGGGRRDAGFSSHPDIPATPEPFSIYDILGSAFFRPLGTARLNPQGSTFCLAESGAYVLVPVLLNNTDISTLRYSLAPLGYQPETGLEKLEYFQLSAKELRAIEESRLEKLRPALTQREQEDEYDEYDDDDASDSSSSASTLQKTQSLVHIKIARFGTIRLEQIIDSSNVEARLAYASEVTVVPCPKVQFIEDTSAAVRCAGQDQDLELNIDIRGVPPLSLRWFKVVNERPEHFIVEGIDSDLADGDGKAGTRRKGEPQELKVPLTVSLSAPGSYFYALEEVVDALGNITTRSLVVLRTPTVSFKNCGPGSPASLLIGSEAHLLISTNTADALDAPWEVSLSYKPPVASDDASGARRFYPWKKTLATLGSRRELDVRATAPGEYTILGVKGKWCAGDVLAPETCTVVEKPTPTAEIEWRKIHECSGDTGVSASLVLHGTPPFQVYHTVQRDAEPPRESSKSFSTSRGELSIQPAQAWTLHKKMLSSCAGSLVDVDVELRGTGPWNLEVRIVSPTGSETLQIRDIKTCEEEASNSHSCTVSIEDVYECKRPVSVPAVTVNVRRIKVTFHIWTESKCTVLEQERTSLPLRLTGDGVSLTAYLRVMNSSVQSAVLNSANDVLSVHDAGLYQIVDIADSQCPGFVVAEASTFRVNWIPRPSAKLSAETAAAATYEAYNGSHILSPICENMDAHIDLDLTGRPPFQILYNIAAQNNENGGTKLLGQPTFNSIQPRTRFELQTSNPGRVYYEVKQIGDAAYPLAQHKNAVIPRSQRLLFEQQVNMRPSARFRTRTRLAYCLNDAFAVQDPLSLDGLSYEFKSIGPHLVVLESVSDASSCPQAPLDPISASIWVDVAETAAIIPVDRREHYCVGHVSQFQLEGVPPWTIGYTINGKAHSEEAKVSPFSLIQQQPGEFTITSIAHQQKMCKAVVTDLRLNVHPLPAAQVGHGKRIYQDIHEGDQAEIVFTLIGEPPFTFTYQRAELSPKKGGKPGKVLETHTVSRVTNHEYSIFSAMEGTWTVTSITDRYCRYPKNSDNSQEK
ncbi:hypothetical protein C8R46DRAFT_1162713 [Mycena filopes]|nr:hypothetical protein C8R46DRAFT_1162713 [Mycena filopes]